MEGGTVMFYGLSIPNNLPVSPKLKSNSVVQISNVAFTCPSRKDKVDLFVKKEEGKFLLISLSHGQTSAKIKLSFSDKDNLVFLKEGEGAVHLTGTVKSLQKSQRKSGFDVSMDRLQQIRERIKKQNSKRCSKSRGALKTRKSALEKEILEIETETDEGPEFRSVKRVNLNLEGCRFESSKNPKKDKGSAYADLNKCMKSATSVKKSKKQGLAILVTPNNPVHEKKAFSPQQEEPEIKCNEEEVVQKSEEMSKEKEERQLIDHEHQDDFEGMGEEEKEKDPPKKPVSKPEGHKKLRKIVALSNMKNDSTPKAKTTPFIKRKGNKIVLNLKEDNTNVKKMPLVSSSEKELKLGKRSNSHFGRKRGRKKEKKSVKDVSKDPSKMSVKRKRRSTRRSRKR